MLTMGDKLRDFYLVEEGIRQNKCTIRYQEDVSKMIRGRARAEYMYMQEIKNWRKNSHNGFPTNVGDRDMLDFFQSASSEDMDHLMELHRKIYDEIMAKDGPYEKIRKEFRPEQGTAGLADIEKEFLSYKTQRSDLENLITEQKESIDYMKALMIGLEEKLFKKIGKKSNKARKKVSSLQARMAHLRECIKSTSAACMEGETVLRSYINSKKKTLQMMFLELEELDTGRYTMICEVVSQFTKIITPQRGIVPENEENLEFPTTHVVQNKTACTLNSDAVVKNTLVMKYPSPLVTEYSEDEIETLELPEETPRPLPNPFTVREFCVDEAENDNHFPKRSGGNYPMAMSDDPPDCSTNKEDERCRKIKVVANINYKGQNGKELSLKKGQIIKQIMLDSKEGFAFGYTRKHKWSFKKYGWYPISIVSYL